MFNFKHNRQKRISLVAVLLCCAMTSNAQSVQESAKVYAAEQSHDDLFGFDVAIHKNRILVGALKQDHDKYGNDSGAAFVYRLDDGQWQPEPLHLPQNFKPNDGFGGKLAIHENFAAIGAIGFDGATEDGGVVFLYQLSKAQWREADRISAPDSQPGDAFGQSIALTPDRLIVGAPKDDDKGEDAGSVYVFVKNGQNWNLEQKLTASDGAAGDVFGISVAISDDTLLIGADLNDEKANNAGAAYVFVKQGEKWIQQAKLMADDAGDTDIFGVRVALDGDTALISARRDDDEVVGKDAGSAYVFRRKGELWFQEAKLIGPTQKADDRFGRSVALQGNTALIGAMHKDYTGENAGAAYLYQRSGNTWQHTRTLTASDGKAGDQLGWSVALSSEHAVVAAAKNAPEVERSGAVYVFDVAYEQN